MELKELPRKDGIVEVAYLDEKGNSVLRPGYIQAEFRPTDNITLLKSLDRNWTGYNQPRLSIDLSKIKEVKFLSWYVKGKSEEKEREISNVLQVEGVNIFEESNKTAQYGYLQGMDTKSLKRPYPDIDLYQLRDLHGNLHDLLSIPGEKIQGIMHLYIIKTFEF